MREACLRVEFPSPACLMSCQLPLINGKNLEQSLSFTRLGDRRVPDIGNMLRDGTGILLQKIHERESKSTLF